MDDEYDQHLERLAYDRQMREAYDREMDEIYADWMCRQYEEYTRESLFVPQILLLIG